MSEQKVPLPEPRHVLNHQGPCALEFYGADQLQSYGDAREQAGWNAALEWAVGKCVLQSARWIDDRAIYVANECAAAIREGRK